MTRIKMNNKLLRALKPTKTKLFTLGLLCLPLSASNLYVASKILDEQKPSIVITQSAPEEKIDLFNGTTILCKDKIEKSILETGVLKKDWVKDCSPSYCSRLQKMPKNCNPITSAFELNMKNLLYPKSRLISFGRDINGDNSNEIPLIYKFGGYRTFVCDPATENFLDEAGKMPRKSCKEVYNIAELNEENNKKHMPREKRMSIVLSGMLSVMGIIASAGFFIFGVIVKNLGIKEPKE